MQDFLVGRVGHSVFPLARGPGLILIRELDPTRCDQELVCMHACAAMSDSLQPHAR